MLGTMKCKGVLMKVGGEGNYAEPECSSPCTSSKSRQGGVEERRVDEHIVQRNGTQSGYMSKGSRRE